MIPLYEKNRKPMAINTVYVVLHSHVHGRVC